LAGLHICPASSLDVPDDPVARLVILRPADEYKPGPTNNALTAAEDILGNRGTGPRIYRNMLAFIAPDHGGMDSLKKEVRFCLAWKSIKTDSQDLNLDAAQNRETENSLKRSNDTVDLRLKEAYSWLLAPNIDRHIDMKTIQWDTIRLSGGSEGIIAKAVKKMTQDESLIAKWAPVHLLMELDNLLWRDQDSIAVKTLWEQLCTYCYLPRLANYAVLEDCIREGLTSKEYFAYAAGLSEGRFLDLKYNQPVGSIDQSGLLVKREAALRQLAEKPPEPETARPPDSTEDTPPREPETKTGPAEPPPPEPPPDTHFFMSAPLDSTRINRDVQRLLEEVINHFMSVPGAEIEVSLEANVRASRGISQQLIKIVTEHCRTLKVKTFGFD
jgi:hypothetical protein